MSEEPAPPDAGAASRRAVVRQGVWVAVATSLYGVSFGALSVAGGLTVTQTCALSLLLFSGGSQFALVGILGGGGTVGAAVAAASLLGVRNALYGLQLVPTMQPTGWRRAAIAQLTIDESTAVAVSQAAPPLRRLGFWVTGLGVYLGWNLMTFLGALAGDALGDPKRFGLDAAASAAFVALLWPRLRARQPVAIAVVGAVVTTALIPVIPQGLPVLAAAFVGALVALWWPDRWQDAGRVDG
ncbi:MAG TPA: AzlC family ABC transporter permease [Actinomycetospora sp.]|jgi:predicted branched-subunit amino acid permease|uniref:AzlC family ABC transporter permease n=1 Tax=Actinomycetospora sp. TaxID=1872135 RepID=UPI002F3F99A5